MIISTLSVCSIIAIDCQKHRQAEIHKYVLDRLQKYEQYYWPEWGGFPFTVIMLKTTSMVPKFHWVTPSQTLRNSHASLGNNFDKRYFGLERELGLEIPVT